MRTDSLRKLLQEVRNGQLGIENALTKLKALPYENLGFAKIDHHRDLRKGLPEVIYGEGKNPEHILSIVDALVKAGSDAVVSRSTVEAFKIIRKKYKNAVYHEDAKMIVVKERSRKDLNKGLILVISAGTSDIPVAEEAAVMAETSGNLVNRLYDVGVAGIHRLLDHTDIIMSANVLIVVAGMEGALPSVVGGLVDKPVIAVPTSVGYGASFRGLTALLGMLNSCASNVAVVNIDNGFGAGYIAHLINRMAN